jgi:tetratricopeptide (TPR) repeat protein
LAVHIGSALLVWWLVLLTFSTPAMKEDKISQHADILAILAGLVFVSHPVAVEAVTYIWQRASSMAAFFYLASLCFYVRSRLPLQPPGLRGLSLAFAILAMFTKENAITLPLMVLFYEYCFFKTKKGLEWRNVIPFFLVMLVIPLTMLFAKSARFQAVNDLTTGAGGNTPFQYLLTQFRVMVTYLRLVFLPLDLNLDYDYPVYKSIFELPVLASILVLISIFIFAKSLFSKYRLVSFSIFWFFLTLLPESSFLPLKDVIFEHRLYLPLAGFSLFLVSGVYYFWGKDHIKLMVLALTMIIACNAGLTYLRNKVWINDITLYSDAVQKSPDKARPYSSLGVAYDEQGNFIQALSNFDKVIAINPSFTHAYFNRGAFYEKQGNLTRALSDYNRAIEVDPNDAEAFYNRGNVHNKQNDPALALSDYDKAIRICPNYEKAYINRAVTIRRLRNFTNE